jgi:hypothetical protein
VNLNGKKETKLTSTSKRAPQAKFARIPSTKTRPMVLIEYFEISCIVFGHMPLKGGYK